MFLLGLLLREDTGRVLYYPSATTITYPEQTSYLVTRWSGSRLQSHLVPWLLSV